MNNQLIKSDADKPKYSTVPTGVIQAIERVRAHGIAKYGKAESWREVAPERYREALLRHVIAWWDDPTSVDKESGLPHVEHIACNAAFLIELGEDPIMPQELYRCDICHEIWQLKAEAKRCEERHRKAVEITGQKFDRDDKNGLYPQSVNIQMSDGRTITYKRG